MQAQQQEEQPCCFDPKGQSYTFYRQDIGPGGAAGRNYEKTNLQDGRVFDSSGQQRHHDPEHLHRSGLAVTKEYRVKLREAEYRAGLEEKLAVFKAEYENAMAEYNAQMANEIRAAEEAEQEQFAPPMEVAQHQTLPSFGPKFKFEGLPTPKLDGLIPPAPVAPKQYFSDVKVPAFGQGAVAVNQSRPIQRYREAVPAMMVEV